MNGMRRLRHTLQLVLFAGLLLSPQWAHACAVCFSAKEGTRTAFLVTTVALSLLPLGAIGGVIYWLRKKAKELDALDAQPGART